MNPQDVSTRLKSRKFWVTIVFGVVVLFGDELGAEITTEQLWSVAAVVGSWLGIQGVADLRK